MGVIDKAYEAIREHWGNRNYYLIKESILYYAEKQTWAVLLKLYDGQYIYSANYVTRESEKSAPCVIYQEKAEQGGIGNCGYFNPEKNFEALESIIAGAKDSYFVDYCGINEENGKKYYIYTSIIEGIDKEMKTERMYWEPVAGAINILY